MCVSTPRNYPQSKYFQVSNISFSIPIANGKTLGQVLLTTCVGSVEELEEMVSMIGPVLRKTWQSVGASTAANTSSSSLNAGGSIRSNSQVSGIFGAKPNLLWNTEALRTLYHFVRCSQLEYVGQDGRLPIQARGIHR